jgi:hypothetical protein
MAGRKNTLSIRKAQRNVAERKQKKFTLADAFHPHWEPDLIPGETAGQYDSRVQHWNVERGIRAIALLLDQATDGGNTPLEGMAANGLSYLLRGYADDMRRLHEFSALIAGCAESDLLAAARRELERRKLAAAEQPKAAGPVAV